MSLISLALGLAPGFAARMRSPLDERCGALERRCEALERELCETRAENARLERRLDEARAAIRAVYREQQLTALQVMVDQPPVLGIQQAQALAAMCNCVPGRHQLLLWQQSVRPLESPWQPGMTTAIDPDGPCPPKTGAPQIEPRALGRVRRAGLRDRRDPLPRLRQAARFDGDGTRPGRGARARGRRRHRVHRMRPCDGLARRDADPADR